MKRSILVILILSCLLWSCKTNKSKDVTVLNWGTMYNGTPQTLNGKIKEIRSNIYWCSEKGGKMEEGTLLTLKEHADSGIIQDFHAFYNEKGLLLRCDFLGDNSRIDWSHVNDIAGDRVTKENWVRNDSIFGYALFTYNDKGFITEVPMHWNKATDSANASKLVLKCDEKGNMTQMEVLNLRKKSVSITEYRCNESGLTTEVKDFMPPDSIVDKSDISYNDHGFIENWKSFNAKGKLISDLSGTYTYDEKGNYVQVIWKRAGKPLVIEKRTYIYY